MHKTVGRIKWVFVVTLVVLVTVTWSLHAEESRPNIVLIVVDDLRFDEIGVGGHPYLETPNIDRLAAEGAMFTSAYHVDAALLAQPRQSSSRGSTCRATVFSTTPLAVTPATDWICSRRNCKRPDTHGARRQMAHGQRSHAATGLRLLGELCRAGQDQRSGSIRGRAHPSGQRLHYRHLHGSRHRFHREV